MLKPAAHPHPGDGRASRACISSTTRATSPNGRTPVSSAITSGKRSTSSTRTIPAQHTQRLAQSDGVLLVWGNADEDWCSREFLEIVQTARRTTARGLCVFDPKEPRSAPSQQIRRGLRRDCTSASSSARSIRRGCETFFTPLRRAAAGGANRELCRGRRSGCRTLENPYPGLRAVRDRRIAPVLRARPAGRRARQPPRAQSLSRRRRRLRQREVVARARRPDSRARTRRCVGGGQALADGGHAAGWRSVRALGAGSDEGRARRLAPQREQPRRSSTSPDSFHRTKACWSSSISSKSCSATRTWSQSRRTRGEARDQQARRRGGVRAASARGEPSPSADLHRHDDAVGLSRRLRRVPRPAGNAERLPVPDSAHDAAAAEGGDRGAARPCRDRAEPGAADAERRGRRTRPAAGAAARADADVEPTGDKPIRSRRAESSCRTTRRSAASTRR